MSEEQPRELPSFWPLEKTVVYLPGDHVEIKKSIDKILEKEIGQGEITYKKYKWKGDVDSLNIRIFMYAKHATHATHATHAKHAKHAANIVEFQRRKGDRSRFYKFFKACEKKLTT